MLNSITTDGLTINTFLICTIGSVLLGTFLAWLYGRFGDSSKGFIITLALLPPLVQMVVMLVNGNLGTGIAIMGAFSLIRFRSVPGTAKEIGSIFLSMTIGLATGTGYIAAAVMFAVMICGVYVLYNKTGFGEPKRKDKDLKITIPEGLDYTGVFDDLFARYTAKSELTKVKTSNMGSLYKLEYRIRLNDPSEEKKLLDELRCRNGNLEISIGRVSFGYEEL